MTHLVTGGSGFLGNLMSRHLATMGEAVRTLDIWEDASHLPDIEFINCSILNREGVALAMKGVDVVYHMAALVPVARASIRDSYQVNVEGTRIVVEEAARANVKCFIHLSSSSIFGIPTRCPIDSKSLPKPVDPYGKSKLASELAAEEIAHKTGMSLISIRPRTVLGEGRLGIFQLLFDWIKRDMDVYTMGSGNNTIQFIHANDLISACLLLRDMGKSGSYNIGTDRYTTVRKMLESLINHAESHSQIKNLPESLTINMLKLFDKLDLIPLVPFHYLTYGKDFYCDLSPLAKLGWKPKYSNVEMLCESYDSFIRNHDQSMRVQNTSAHRKPVNEKLFWLLKQL